MLDKTHLLITAANLDRYGRKNDYKAALEYFKTTIDIGKFKKKFLSLKYFVNGDEEYFDEIADYYECNGFDIFVHEDTWTTKQSIDKRRDGTGRFFCGRLADDYARIFTNNEFLDAEYAFIMDDDCAVKVVSGDFESGLNEASKILKDRCLHSIHYPRTFIDGKYFTSVEYAKRQKSTKYVGDNNYFGENNFNFQPRICKMQDNKIVGKIVQALWKDCFYQKHPETVIGEALRAKYVINGSEPCFLSVNPDDAYSLHLGETQLNHEFIVDNDPILKEIYSKL